MISSVDFSFRAISTSPHETSEIAGFAPHAWLRIWGQATLSSAISDFIMITTSGPDSLVSVDRDGTAGTYSMAQIAMIAGVTGLEDEAALLANGNIIAA